MNTSTWVGLGSAFVGAVGLHLGLASAVFDASSPRGVTVQTPGAVEVTQVVIEARPIASAPPAPAAPREVAKDADLASAAAATTDLPAPATVTDEAQQTAPAGRRYFTVSEVDTPAMPQPEWHLDVPMLVGLGVYSFSVDMLIGDSGTAEQCVLTQMIPEQTPEVRAAVAATLCTTALSPALRRGVPVPSVRHIELIIAPS